jgi:hypothetical protein
LIRKKTIDSIDSRVLKKMFWAREREGERETETEEAT